MQLSLGNNLLLSAQARKASVGKFAALWRNRLLVSCAVALWTVVFFWGRSVTAAVNAWGQVHSGLFAACAGVLFGGAGDVLAQHSERPSGEAGGAAPALEEDAVPLLEAGGEDTATLRSCSAAAASVQEADSEALRPPSPPLTAKQRPVGRALRLDRVRAAAVAAYTGASALVFWDPLVSWLDAHFSGTSFKAVAAKTLLDVCVAVPLVDIPCFYLSTVGPRLGCAAAVSQLREGYVASVVAGLALWLPTMAFTFALCPRHLILPFMYWVNMLWYFQLSRRAQPKSSVALDKPAVL
jgi:hypothetical protein